MKKLIELEFAVLIKTIEKSIEWLISSILDLGAFVWFGTPLASTSINQNETALAPISTSPSKQNLKTVHVWTNHGIWELKERVFGAVQLVRCKNLKTSRVYDTEDSLDKAVDKILGLPLRESEDSQVNPPPANMSSKLPASDSVHSPQIFH